MLARLKKAFPATMPVLTGYLFLGVAFGVTLFQAGYGWPWALLMCLIVYAGAMQFVAIDLLLLSAGFVEVLLMSLLVNARQLFYGMAMAGRFRDLGAQKPYAAFALTDETFALLSTVPPPEGMDRRTFDLSVSLLNHSYWVLGCLLGSLLGQALPLDLSGIEFSMTALFVVLMTDQWRRKAARVPVLIGLGSALLCLLLLGPERFSFPAMLLICFALLLTRNREGEKRA